MVSLGYISTARDSLEQARVKDGNRDINIFKHSVPNKENGTGKTDSAAVFGGGISSSFLG
jgi:hypothetical protein